MLTVARDMQYDMSEVDCAALGPPQATTEASLKRAAERAAKPPGSRKAGKPQKEEPPQFGLFETQCLVIINVRHLQIVPRAPCHANPGCSVDEIVILRCSLWCCLSLL